MRKMLIIAVAAFSFACFMPAPAALAVEAAPVTLDAPATPVTPVAPAKSMHRLGFGVNYWKTIDNIDVENVDEHGFSYIASYQYAPVPFFKIEADLEYMAHLAGSTDPVFAPELFAAVGGLIYAGAGIGTYYSGGDWASSPFYTLRAGLDLPIAPRLFLDINVNYRFNDWDSLEWSDLDTDTVRLGAALRFTL